MTQNHLVRKNYAGLTCFSLSGFPLRHGFFARTGGVSPAPFASLNTAYVTKDSNAERNREILFRAFFGEVRGAARHSDCKKILHSAGPHPPVRILNPCHGERIAFVGEEDWRGKNKETRLFEKAGFLRTIDVLIKTDAAFTRTPDTCLLVSTGDCVPAIFTDFYLSFAGVAHLGWRNLVDGFAGKVVRALGERYGLPPRVLQVGVGPMIHPCCYVFKDPMQKDDPFWKPFLEDRGDGRYAIDLASAFRAQLLEQGVRRENILETGLCTSCRNELFFSCYKEGRVSGRFPTMIAFRKWGDRT